MPEEETIISNNSFNADVAKVLVEAVFQKIVDPTLAKMDRKRKRLWGLFKHEFGLSYSKYLENAYNKYSKAKTLLYRYEPQPLNDFFVAPILKMAQDEEFVVTTTASVYSRSSFVIIQGLGGMGKSMLMKYLFLNEIEEKGYIPIFYELKDLNNIENDYELSDLFFDKLSNMGSTLDKECLDDALSSGCFLFLLDGYDEVISQKRERFYRKLEIFCDKYSNNNYIISSRPFSEFIDMQRFTILETKPFSKDQAISLVKKLKYDEETKNRFIQALEEMLYKDYESFVSNPLLLTIMLLTYDSYALMPQKLHVFYSNAFETLYQRHDATKAGYRREIKSGLSFDDFKNVFAKFCFITYARQQFEFSRDEIIEFLSKGKKYLFDNDNFIYDLAFSVCVLYKDGLTYRFVHRSFQEYFSAYYLKTLSDDNMKSMAMKLINNDQRRSASDNVISMLFDMAPERVEKNVFYPYMKEFEKDLSDNNKSYEYYRSKLIDSYTGIESLALKIEVNQNIITICPSFSEDVCFIGRIYKCYTGKDISFCFLKNDSNFSLSDFVDKLHGSGIYFFDSIDELQVSSLILNSRIT